MTTKAPLVVIVGGGFGGLAAAKGLKRSPVDVLLIDRSNRHLFQPLQYQVATSALASGQIALSIRSLLADQTNTSVSNMDYRHPADRTGFLMRSCNTLPLNISPGK
jgi:NADH:ubiquinone reductase (H+-translocating)